MENLMLFLSNFIKRETTIRAIRVAFVVTPILIFINHHEVIIGLKFTPVFFFKLLLTFLVPYSVSAYSSARAYSEKSFEQVTALSNNNNS